MFAFSFTGFTLLLPVFWGSFLVWQVTTLASERQPYQRVGRMLVIAGAAMNALVIVTNGGMPVPLDRAHLIGDRYWWIPVADDQWFLSFADWFWGFSFGDALIVAGAIIWVACWLDRRSRLR